MESRLHLESKDKSCFIERQTGLVNLTELELLRKNDNRFKYQRINIVLQAYPDEVPLNTIIERKI